MEHKQKIAAAIAAVTAYIKSEEEALCLQAAAPAARPKPPAPAAAGSLWGASGRQAMMQVRNLMQLKAFHRR